MKNKFVHLSLTKSYSNVVYRVLKKFSGKIFLPKGFLENTMLKVITNIIWSIFGLLFGFMGIVSITYDPILSLLSFTGCVCAFLCVASNPFGDNYDYY